MNTDFRDDLLERLQAAPPEEREWLLMDFSLAQLPEKLRAAVWAAAIPHWFDRAFLNALLSEPLAEAEFQALVALSFVEPFPGERWNIHERTRNLLLGKLWQDDPERYRELSHRALAYCQTQDQADTAWRIETVYHWLIAEPAQGVMEMGNLGREWHNSPNFAYDKVEALARAGREHMDAGRLEILGKHMVLFWEALLDTIFSRPFAALDKFRQIDLARETRDYFKAECLFRLGGVHLRLSEAMEARGWYEQALPLCQAIGYKLGEANCLKSLGDVHLRLSEAMEAQARYEQALPVFQAIGDRLGEANCLKALGDVHLSLSEAMEARARYEQALPVFQAIGSRLGEANCLKCIGEVCLEQAAFSQAQEKFAQAQAIYQAIGEQIGQADSLRMFGKLAVKTGDYPAARTCYEQATAQFERIGGREGIAECLEGFAELYEAQGNLKEAAESWAQAAELYEALKMPLRAAPCREKAAAIIRA